MAASKIDVQVWMGHISPTSPPHLPYISRRSPYISLHLQVWMDHVLKTVGGGKVLTAKKAATSPKVPG